MESLKGETADYHAHTGRVTVSVIAMFAKDENNKTLISTDMLTHQHNWKRSTEVLARYMGKNASLAEGGFLSKMMEIRRNHLEDRIEESAIKDFRMRNIDTDRLNHLFPE